MRKISMVLCPLYFAAREGHTDLAILLIKHGASINQKVDDGNLPLHVAAIEGHTDFNSVIDQVWSICESR